MVNFNMIDTVGRGIKKIYTEQRNRFFPMPDYDIDNEHRTVGVIIYGKMIDEKYTNLLKSNQSLSLKECLWLDAVQKHHPNSIQKLLLQLAHNAGEMGFWRKDAFEGLQHVFPANNTRNEKLRKIGRLLVNMAKDELIVKSSNGKKWLITEKGEKELYS